MTRLKSLVETKWIPFRDGVRRANMSCGIVFRCENKRIVYSLQCPPQKRREGEKIVCEILAEAISEIRTAFCFPDCSREQRVQAAAHLQKQYPHFLNTLFNEGCEACQKAVKRSSAALKLSLDIEAMEEHDGKFYNRKGQVFDPESGCWTGGGEMIQDHLSLILWDFYSGDGRKKAV